MSSAASRRVMPAAVATAILTDVAGGATIKAAAATHGYSARTVERYANRHPDYALELTRAKTAGAAARGPRPPTEPRPIDHGVAGYRRGCRCDICKAANTAQVRRWRGSRRTRRVINRRAV